MKFGLGWFRGLTPQQQQSVDEVKETLIKCGIPSDGAQIFSGKYLTTSVFLFFIFYFKAAASHSSCRRDIIFNTIIILFWIICSS